MAIIWVTGIVEFLSCAVYWSLFWTQQSATAKRVSVSFTDRISWWLTQVFMMHDFGQLSSRISQYYTMCGNINFHSKLQCVMLYSIYFIILLIYVCILLWILFNILWYYNYYIIIICRLIVVLLLRYFETRPSFISLRLAIEVWTLNWHSR